MLVRRMDSRGCLMERDMVLSICGDGGRLGELPSHGILCQTLYGRASGSMKAKEKSDEC